MHARYADTFPPWCEKCCLGGVSKAGPGLQGAVCVHVNPLSLRQSFLKKTRGCVIVSGPNRDGLETQVFASHE